MGSKWGGGQNPWGDIASQEDSMPADGAGLLALSSGELEEESEQTSWIRLELINCKSPKKSEEPLVLAFHSIELGVRNSPRIKLYEEELPSPRVVQWDYRPYHLRLSRLMTRSIGRSREFFPYYPFISLSEEAYSLY